MERILSSEEVQALLRESAGAAASPEPPRGEVEPFPLFRHRSLPSARLRAFEFLHERFAQNLSVSLSAYLRAATEARLESIEQVDGRTFLARLPDPTGVFVAEIEGRGSLVVELGSLLALALVDRMLGGRGARPAAERALTEIELTVLEGLVELVLGELRAVWRPSLDVGIAIRGRETRPALVSLAAPDEPLIDVTLAVTFSAGEGEAVAGTLRVGVPAALVEALAAKLAKELEARRPGAAESVGEDVRRRIEAFLLRLPVELVVELGGRGITAGDLIHLGPGAVVDLGRPVTDPAVVRIGGAAVIEGVLALAETKRAFEITKVPAASPRGGGGES